MPSQATLSWLQIVLQDPPGGDLHLPKQEIRRAFNAQEIFRRLKTTEPPGQSEEVEEMIQHIINQNNKTLQNFLTYPTPYSPTPPEQCTPAMAATAFETKYGRRIYGYMMTLPRDSYAAIGMKVAKYFLSIMSMEGVKDRVLEVFLEGFLQYIEEAHGGQLAGSHAKSMELKVVSDMFLLNNIDRFRAMRGEFGITTQTLHTTDDEEQASKRARTWGRIMREYLACNVGKLNVVCEEYGGFWQTTLEMELKKRVDALEKCEKEAQECEFIAGLGWKREVAVAFFRTARQTLLSAVNTTQA